MKALWRIFLLCIVGNNVVLALDLSPLAAAAHKVGFPFLLQVAAVFTIAVPSTAAEWDLLNGHVSLPDRMELVLDVPSNNNKRLPTEKTTLRNPTLIGAGSGGSVFKFDGSSVLLKISWGRQSTPSVHRECLVLQRLQSAKVESTETCLGEFPYVDGHQDRIMIAVTPYVDHAVSTIHEVQIQHRPDVVQQLARTLIQMLAHNIVTVDVQPLINASTGQLVLIDMTEAQVIHEPYSFLDTTLMTSFVTEMLGVIPEEYAALAAKTMIAEIQVMQQQGTPLSKQAQHILLDQAIFP